MVSEQTVVCATCKREIPRLTAFELLWATDGVQVGAGKEFWRRTIAFACSTRCADLYGQQRAQEVNGLLKAYSEQLFPRPETGEQAWAKGS